MRVMKGLNLRGVTEFCRAVVRQPQLLLPQISVKDLNEISFQALKDKGFQGVIFDKDNTLTIPYHHEVAVHLQEPFADCKKVFGDRILIFSNSAGSNDDPTFKKAQEIENAMHVAVLRHNEKKPGGIEHVQQYFDVAPEKLIMIGDRYSTDILFGNMHEQFTKEGESFVNIQMQRIEKAMIALLVRSGVTPKEHPLLKVSTNPDEEGEEHQVT